MFSILLVSWKQGASPHKGLLEPVRLLLAPCGLGANWEFLCRFERQFVFHGFSKNVGSSVEGFPDCTGGFLPEEGPQITTAPREERVQSTWTAGRSNRMESGDDWALHAFPGRSFIIICFRKIQTCGDKPISALSNA